MIGIMKRSLLLLLCAIALSAQQPAKPTLESKLSASSYAFSLGNGKLAGPGAPILQGEIAKAGFVLIGEDHLTRQIPRLVSAVCDAMAATGGISAMAFESSPAAAAFTQQRLAASSRLADMAELQKRSPDSIAFLNIPAESDLAAHCAAASARQDFQIWGLDQEFVGSAGWIVDRMLAANSGPTARAATLKLQAAERAAVDEA